jgi:hypothetical protein
MEPAKGASLRGCEDVVRRRGVFTASDCSLLPTFVYCFRVLPLSLQPAPPPRETSIASCLRLQHELGPLVAMNDDFDFHPFEAPGLPYSQRGTHPIANPLRSSGCLCGPSRRSTSPLCASFSFTQRAALARLSCFRTSCSLSYCRVVAGRRLLDRPHGINVVLDS